MSIDHIADDLAIAATSVPTPNCTRNSDGSHDIATARSIVRTEIVDGVAHLIVFRPNVIGGTLYSVTFSEGTPRPVIVAAVHAAYHAAVAADRHAEIEQAAL